MLRGRVMAVAAMRCRWRVEDEDGPRQREANFTWSAAVPEGNELVAGRWWSSPTTRRRCPWKQDFAERLGIGWATACPCCIGSPSQLSRAP
jgi:putative ABC transport system permease protein